MDYSELLLKRRSVRAYKEQSVSEEELRTLIEAVRLAPTWKNSQTGRYYIAVTPEKLEQVRECLPSFNQRSSAGAGALVVTTFKKGIAGFGDGKPANEAGDEWGAYDLGLQNAYFILKASDMGLDTLIMGLRDGDGLRACLNIPADEEVMAVIAVGKRSTEPLLKDRRSVDDIAAFF